MGVPRNIGRAPACAAIALSSALCLAAWAVPVRAELQTASANTTENRAIGAFLTYCLPAVTAGGDVARVAKMRKLPQLPPEEQQAVLKGKHGKVYELPEVGPGAMLTAATPAPACSVMLEKVDARAFLEQATYWFSGDHTPFRLTVNKTLVNGDIQREYQADIDGQNVVLHMTLRLKPVPGGAQAMLTGDRAGE